MAACFPNLPQKDVRRRRMRRSRTSMIAGGCLTARSRPPQSAAGAVFLVRELMCSPGFFICSPQGPSPAGVEISGAEDLLDLLDKCGSLVGKREPGG